MRILLYHRQCCCLLKFTEGALSPAEDTGGDRDCVEKPEASWEIPNQSGPLSMQSRERADPQTD